MPTPEEIRDMEHKHIVLSYNQINEFIYAGNNMCCQTHFEKELLAKGITADISLELERLDNPKGVSYFFLVSLAGGYRSEYGIDDHSFKSA